MHIPPKHLKLIGMNPTGDLAGLTAYTSRRAGTVWFPKSPPLTPATPWQLVRRNFFRTTAWTWRALTPPQRDDWHNAARAARLILNGYTLFVWWQLKRDRSTLATIERISGIQLLQ